MTFKKVLIVLLSAILLTLSGCASKSDTDNRPVIAVSIVPEATFVEKVCGDKFKIVTMIPSGASPETYEPTPAEMVNLSRAELYFAIGVPAEESSILPSVSDSTELIQLHKFVNQTYPDLEEHGGRDPHIWLSPKRVIVMVEKITEKLCEYDSEKREKYKKNAEAYISELEVLDNEISALAKNAKGNDFIVFHPSFGYFADDYGLTMHALEEHGKEATAKGLTEMVNLAKQKKITTIFYQAEASSKQAEAFAEEINGKAVKLEPLSPDYTKNMRKLATEIFKAVN